MYFPNIEPVVGIELKALRSFDFAERHYERGDRFPWRDVGCPYFTAWQMWLVGQLEVDGVEMRAAKDFVHLSGKYRRGDRFDWKRLDIDERNMGEMIRAGLLEVASVAPYRKSEPAPIKTQQQQSHQHKKHHRPA